MIKFVFQEKKVDMKQRIRGKSKNQGGYFNNFKGDLN